ncbi:hypothetical protein FOA52_004285 [Chlamydomonas sp. UWO 241]|nr:hypothetical protein FOA52_004285 [Chlamydomonas sp. UWO 241]
MLPSKKLTLNGVPIELATCFELRVLDLRGNPLCDALPPPAAGSPAEAEAASRGGSRADGDCDATFASAYSCGQARALVDPATSDAAVLRGTRALLAALRDRIDEATALAAGGPSAWAHVVLERRAAAAASLRAALGVADGARLTRAHNAAAAAGVAHALLASAACAVEATGALRAAAAERPGSPPEHVAAALLAWEAHSAAVGVSPPVGPDYADAKAAARRARAQSVRPGGSGGGGTSAGPSSPSDGGKRVSSPRGGPGLELASATVWGSPMRARAQTARAAAQASPARTYGVGVSSHEAWVASKAVDEAAGRQAARSAARIERSASERAAAADASRKSRLHEREMAWPSRIVLPHPHRHRRGLFGGLDSFRPGTSTTTAGSNSARSPAVCGPSSPHGAAAGDGDDHRRARPWSVSPGAASARGVGGSGGGGAHAYLRPSSGPALSGMRGGGGGGGAVGSPREWSRAGLPTGGRGEQQHQHQHHQHQQHQRPGTVQAPSQHQHQHQQRPGTVHSPSRPGTVQSSRRGAGSSGLGGVGGPGQNSGALGSSDVGTAGMAAAPGGGWQGSFGIPVCPPVLPPDDLHADHHDRHDHLDQHPHAAPVHGGSRPLSGSRGGSAAAGGGEGGASRPRPGGDGARPSGVPPRIAEGSEPSSTPSEQGEPFPVAPLSGLRDAGLFPGRPEAGAGSDVPSGDEYSDDDGGGGGRGGSGGGGEREGERTPVASQQASRASLGADADEPPSDPGSEYDEDERFFDDEDAEGSAEGGGEPGGGPDESPCLFIDSGNNKDSPSHHAGRAVVVAAGGDVDGGDSLLGASDDLSVLADGRAAQQSLDERREEEDEQEGETEVEDEEEAAMINAASVPLEGPVVADKALLRMPSLDITGDQQGACPREKKRWEV